MLRCNSCSLRQQQFRSTAKATQTKKVLATWLLFVSNIFQIVRFLPPPLKSEKLRPRKPPSPSPNRNIRLWRVSKALSVFRLAQKLNMLTCSKRFSTFFAAANCCRLQRLRSKRSSRRRRASGEAAATLAL